MTAHIPIDLRLRDIDAQLDVLCPETQPPFKHHSRYDWGVMLWGGNSPTTGFPLEPLEFCFPAVAYNRADIEQRASDLAEWHKREHFAVRAPEKLDEMRAFARRCGRA